jgi:hypothetical protein
MWLNGKIQQAMHSSKRYPLGGMVHLNEFFVGEYEEGRIGRNSGSKKRLVVVALEILEDENGVGRAYAKVISHASGKDFKPFFDDYISCDAHVVTDEWKGYLLLRNDYPYFEQKPSGKGSNFPELHIHRLNIQRHLRGIHHHCSKKHLQSYLDEYHYKYNRRNHMDTIFDNLVVRMATFRAIM